MKTLRCCNEYSHTCVRTFLKDNISGSGIIELLGLHIFFHLEKDYQNTHYGSPSNLGSH